MGDGNGSTRMVIGTKKEAEDKARLEQLGCKVFAFGQALLHPELRKVLQVFSFALIRWLSDFIVITPDGLPLEVDSKAGRTDTLYWDIEKKALEAHRKGFHGLRHVIIWPDGETCNYIDDLTDTVLRDGPYHGKGSGTPYWLVSKTIGRSLEDVFGGKSKELSA